MAMWSYADSLVNETTMRHWKIEYRNLPDGAWTFYDVSPEPVDEETATAYLESIIAMNTVQNVEFCLIAQ